ncbi:MAG: hypothetical protein CMK07_09140 [Ponticaulis sp.]|nr:hypothetical protein [Ponticaulis sp.]
MNRQRRQRAEKAGRAAEFVAANWLRLKGYSVLAQRQKTGSGELDLICRKSGMVVIVEVKQRQTLEDAQLAVPDHAWRRIGRAADLWLGKRGVALYDMPRRYDLVILTRRFKLRHIPDAWRPEYPLTHG